MINYREANVSDVSTIVDFQIAMARETEELDLDRDVCTRGVQALFEDASRGRYFLAESNGAVIASLMITYEWSDWRNGNIWWIQSVYVTEEFRGFGVVGCCPTALPTSRNTMDTNRAVRFIGLLQFA